MLDQPPGSPLRGKYLVRNVTANRCLCALDALLSLLFRRGPGRPAVDRSRRILLANGAHLGDVLLSTAVLPVLKAAFPDAEIGFLIGSWARDVLAGHPLVTRLHLFDHWKLNRANVPLRRKAAAHLATRAAALREIRQSKYEVAIDLYYYFPNSIPLLWQASVPTRVGYTSAGFGPLLTHALDWHNRDWHVIEYQAELLRFLSPGAAAGDFRALLSPAASADALPSRDGRTPAGAYVVLHPGAGAAQRVWPEECWRGLAEKLVEHGHRLVFTGNGEGEKRTIGRISEGMAGCVNLCGRLTWREFVAVIREASLVVGVESVVGHVAAAVETPYVAIYGGVTHPAHWRPRGGKGRVLSHPVPCAPCYRSGGCDGMECVRGVEVESVLGAIDELLGSGRPMAA